MTADAKARTARLRLTLEVTVDLEGWRRYIEQYPDFGHEPIGETLAREAIAQWDYEGLLAIGPEPDRTFEVLP